MPAANSEPLHDGYGWRTSISDAGDDYIRIRGYDVEELMECSDFGSVAYLLLTGELPSPSAARVVNALLIAASDHGIAPSSTVARYLAASGVPIQVSIAAGILTFGDIHGGAGQELARLLQDGVTAARSQGVDLLVHAESIVASERAASRRIPGFGHPQHPAGDPRAPVLFALAERHGVAGDHIALLRAIGTVFSSRLGREIAINLDGAMAAVMSDLGIDWRLARALIAVPRGMGLAAHANEESIREPGWRHVPLSVVTYDGPEHRLLTGGEVDEAERARCAENG